MDFGDYGGRDGYRVQCVDEERKVVYEGECCCCLEEGLGRDGVMIASHCIVTAAFFTSKTSHGCILQGGSIVRARWDENTSTSL